MTTTSVATTTTAAIASRLLPLQSPAASGQIMSSSSRPRPRPTAPLLNQRDDLDDSRRRSLLSADLHRGQWPAAAATGNSPMPLPPPPPPGGPTQHHRHRLRLPGAEQLVQEERRHAGADKTTISATTAVLPVTATTSSSCDDRLGIGSSALTPPSNLPPKIAPWWRSHTATASCPAQILESLQRQQQEQTTPGSGLSRKCLASEMGSSEALYASYSSSSRGRNPYYRMQEKENLLLSREHIDDESDESYERFWCNNCGFGQKKSPQRRLFRICRHNLVRVGFSQLSHCLESPQCLGKYICRMKCFRLLLLVLPFIVCSILLSFLLVCHVHSNFVVNVEMARSDNWLYFYQLQLPHESQIRVDSTGAGGYTEATYEDPYSNQTNDNEIDKLGTGETSSHLQLLDQSHYLSSLEEIDAEDEVLTTTWQNSIKKLVRKEELDFPLAFSILMYRDAKQVLMLLRAIYRPHNHYCIHVDAKSSVDLHILVQHWRQHLPNLLVISNPLAVVHSTMSTLLADLKCMEQLLRASSKWRYLINLTGQEYPRKTNLELVRILRALNGANLMNKTPLEKMRVLKRYLLEPPPHNVTLYKGAVHILASREFIQFAVHDPKALDLLRYLNNTLIPDESYFSSLNHNPQLHAPGGFETELYTGAEYPYVNRMKSWNNEPDQLPCHGVYLRLICIWGDRDFLTLTDPRDPTLFINKFVVSINGRLYKRIDQWFHKRQRRIYAQPDRLINVSFYAHLPQVTAAGGRVGHTRRQSQRRRPSLDRLSS